MRGKPRMRSLPHKSDKPESDKSNAEQTKQSKPALSLQTVSLALIAILGLAFMSLLPRFSQQTAPKHAISPSAATVRIENGDQKDGNLHVSWSLPVSQTQFWLDNSPVLAKCDTQNCTVPKNDSVRQIYFRWLDSSDNRWYYFQCNGDYKGQFKGLPYTR